jgi:putative tryptophan/tyrosine transport system substrate-binding protein
MRSRLLLLLIVAVLALAEPPAGAQQPAKVPRIGFLGGANPRLAPILQSFRQGLRELGYVEGQNIIFEHLLSNDTSQFHNFAADLVRLQVDVIVAQNLEPARAAMKATKTIPIVMTFPGDPVLQGFVASLERPGGNVTGVSGLTLELGGKWLELVKETVPSARRVAVFWNRRAEDSFPVWKSVESAARSLGVDVRWEQVGFAVSSPSYPSYPLYRRLRSAALRQADAFIVLPGFAGRNLEDIAEFGLKNRIPGIFGRTDLDIDQMGGLMAYGANRAEQSRRSAYFVDKILKGAKPAELPVELPKSFELVINLKAAKEIGITIPPGVLAWADRVIK